MEELLDEFREILQKTMKWVENYDDFKDMGGQIEHIFKAAKMIFGMDNVLHAPACPPCSCSS
ncbi:hypothetical protein AKJ39_02625 [candidate division MSBL1 archaeon SCGC-AAA259J03]|uniref:Uncharacterized protein n=1 Tax=candidate division MSBL1 archaeon SCGC-AAA259J03 TaxID=1698269 RepID=A0A656YW10_9EURY|nr:hypothetical protein AKJ39_02625 [candidate division MSBL1 archaeon SCGC-AAA259J03]